MSVNQLEELEAHINEHLYLQVNEIVDHVKDTYEVHYSISYMTDL